MKILLIALSLFASLSARAQGVGCIDRSYQDATFYAEIKDLDAKDLQVMLAVPTGETSQQEYYGECSEDKTTKEFSINCSVVIDADTGYDIHFFLSAEGQLNALLTHYNRAGNAYEPELLPCEPL